MNDNGQTDRVVPLRLLSSKGFTLIEIIIVMGIFMGVIIISSQAFNKILSMSVQQTKSSESDTQGVIGLEMMRVDLEHAGYGLPWVLSFPAEFDEAKEVVGHLAPGIDTKQFNDTKMNTPAGTTTTDPNKVPRAIQAATGMYGRDYLVIKSVLAGMNDTVKKWSYVQGADASSKIKAWESNNFVNDERVITIDSRTKRLVGNSSPVDDKYVSETPADFSYKISATISPPPTPLAVTPPAAFQPKQDTDVFVVYGVSPSTDLIAPYNRVDYYVKRPADAPDTPTRCATGTGGKPGTGILYKAVMNHSNGEFTEYPLIECIADMQVVFNVAADGVNGVDVDQSGLAGLSAKEIRQQLKMIKIYIVAHEGSRDTGFNYANQTIAVGEGNGRVLDLKNDVVGSDDYKYYRWKTYKLVVIPKNINY